MNLYLNADCMNPETGLPSYPDKYFDLAIVDPPYGIGEGAKKASTRGVSTAKWKNAKPATYRGGEWDKTPMKSDYFKEVRRVSRNQIIWGANHFIDNIGKANASCWIVWYKVGQNPAVDFADCELAWTSFKKAVKFFRYDWTGFGAVNSGEKRLHPTQKPMALYRWLVKNYAKQGDRILDTHVGSASSLVVYEEMGFEYVGFELDADYYRDSCKRLEAYRAQPKLFTGAEIFEASKQPIQGSLF